MNNSTIIAERYMKKTKELVIACAACDRPIIKTYEVYPIPEGLLYGECEECAKIWPKWNGGKGLPSYQL